MANEPENQLKPVAQLAPIVALKLSHAARPSTAEVQAINERGEIVPTAIAGEHALTVFLDKREMLTLMTLGAAPELLVLGYLRNQEIVSTPNQLASIQIDWDVSAAAVTSRTFADTGVSLWDSQEHSTRLADKMAHKTVTTGCGQGTMFGNLMDSLESIALKPMRLPESVMYRLMDSVRRHESIYKVAGAVHGCCLANSSGEILSFVEDVGRHNAVDAIAGWMWLHQVSGEDKIFYTTGRLTSEMVIKCAQMGISIILSRSGLTQMGFALAQQLGILLIGRCQGKHYLVFTGADRFEKVTLTSAELT